MKKKYLTISLIALLSVSLVACGSSDTDEEEPVQETEEVEEPVQETEEVEESQEEPDMEELKEIYNNLNAEYDRQKNNVDLPAWAAFGRDFRSKTEGLDTLDNNKENMDYNLALGYIKQLHLEYTKVLQDRDGDPEYFKQEIEGLLN